MGDVRTVAWKEWRELMRMSGTRKGAITRHLISVAVISVLWPWQFGLEFLHTNLAVLLSALTAAIHIAGAAPDALAGERERHTLETLLASRLPDRAILLGKIVALLEYGCLASLVMLVFGWITVNVVHGDGQLVWYSRQVLLDSLLYTPVAAGFVASIGVHVSLRAKTVKQAQNTFSTAVLIILFIPIIAMSVVGPENAEQIVSTAKDMDGTMITLVGLAAAVVVQLLLFWWALIRFKRSRLIV